MIRSRTPNERFLLGLSPGALAVYTYLLCCEKRETCQCWPSCNTIDRAMKMSANTVWRYVLELEDKHLIRTELITVVTRARYKRNGTLRYYIRPLREPMDHYHEQQLHRLELHAESADPIVAAVLATGAVPSSRVARDTPNRRAGRVRAVRPSVRSVGLSNLPSGQMNWAVEIIAG